MARDEILLIDWEIARGIPGTAPGETGISFNKSFLSLWEKDTGEVSPRGDLYRALGVAVRLYYGNLEFEKYLHGKKFNKFNLNFRKFSKSFAELPNSSWETPNYSNIIKELNKLLHQ